MADKITSVVAREADGNIQITFTIPFSEVKKAEDETIRELAKDAEIPGFRKGMAPLSKVAEKISQSTLIEHSLSRILPKALAEAITDQKLKIAVYPKFELISAKEGEAWQVRAVTCELPEVNLGDYKKVIEGAGRASGIWTPTKGRPEEKRQLSAGEKEHLVIKTILENIKVTVPSILIKEEADSRLSSLLSRLEKLGLALESYLASIGKKAEDLRADYARQAREAITLDLTLSEIAEVEGLTVDQKEIESALKLSQVASNEKPEDLEKRKRLVKSVLRRRKALDFLINLV
jgi:FKBP-type peptidyl-prolyl cis-trans isomerase (trigger factor)